MRSIRSLSPLLYEKMCIIFYIASEIHIAGIPTPRSFRMETSCVENRQCEVIEPEVSSESGGTLAAAPAQPEYMGVVPLPYGRWGAQFYDRERRVWLGAFDVKAEAARAYDVAVRRFRGCGAVTNFEPLEAEELAFLCSRSKEEIVDMLRKQTYRDELKLVRNRGAAAAAGAEQRKPLFEKALMPSDVGKLNRLVIPKHHAEKHLPLGDDDRGVVLSFEDERGKVWRFRYSYWKSIKTYVLTRGWNWFVKDKGLRAGDVVAFHGSTSGEEKRLFIFPRGGRVAPAAATRSIRLFGVDIVGGAIGAAAAVGIKRKISCDDRSESSCDDAEADRLK
ncbi:AP2/ERF and B3 domain-containing protein Os01g0141000-like [Zingiber officinale]|uniref:Uncharacterized protein n=1 Tax=Zingiber officinale TaxID=94328 RepID=A0A8J5EBS0_ZINOF|nr:AP2/ERF and B3 domain-containing protein Os01g0141000-like [Zingiber officinale]KAG6470807.1 hypothetical protein ZIOFF_071887 [Zingiber officinale]